MTLFTALTLQPGDEILLSDGVMRLTVENVNESQHRVECHFTNGPSNHMSVAMLTGSLAQWKVVSRANY